MASDRKPGPVGLVNSDAGFTGTLARCAPSYPGPVGSVWRTARDGGPTQQCAARPPATGGWFALELGQPGPKTSAAEQSLGLVRIACAGESDASFRRLEFATPLAAKEAAMRLVEHPAAARQLRDLEGAPGVGLASWTAAELQAGRLKILWRKRQPLVVSEQPAAAAPPAPRRTAAPSAPSQPTPEYSTFPPGLDALAVAQVLKAAAQDGVPFCEECMKARAAQGDAPAGAA